MAAHAAPSRGPTYKVVLLGELGVGKTSLFRRIKDNSFDEYQTATTGIDSCSKVIKCGGQTIMLSIWDTAGVERFRTLTRNYYRNAHAAVFVYSVSDASSLHYLAQWIKDAQNFAPHATRMLLGNKIDIEPPEIDQTTANSFAQAHEFELNYTVSCKTNTGIADAFEALAKTLHSAPQQSDAAQQRSKSIIYGDEIKDEPGAETDNNSGGCRC